jgi:hypothetical protein
LPLNSRRFVRNVRYPSPETGLLVANPLKWRRFSECRGISARDRCGWLGCQDSNRDVSNSSRSPNQPPLATSTLGLTPIGTRSVRPQTSNKMIQKETGFPPRTEPVLSPFRARIAPWNPAPPASCPLRDSGCGGAKRRPNRMEDSLNEPEPTAAPGGSSSPRSHAADGSCLRSRPALRGSTGSPRQACSKRHVNMTISLAFLAPSPRQGRVDCRTGSASPTPVDGMPTWN